MLLQGICYFCKINIETLQRYFLHLAYNGSAYHGWQRQENALSVQQLLEDSLKLKLRQNISLTGCGRTDTGVHALSFYAHFDMENPLPAKSKNDWLMALNSFLPRDIVVFDILPVTATANARFDALSRTYQYVITRRKDPFLQHKAYYVFGKLDVKAMQQAADILKQYKDFTSFSKLHSQAKTNLCDIYEANWKEDGDLVVFTISANRFLRDMVRAISGTLLDIGKGKLHPNDIHDIIAAKNRGSAGMSVPAHALFLKELRYPEHIFL